MSVFDSHPFESSGTGAGQSAPLSLTGRGLPGAASAGPATDATACGAARTVTPCFTPGTLIATPRGEVAVESLRCGDRVVTRDNGLQPIRWVGHKAMNWRDFRAHPHLRPVLVRQGSLGNSLPERDMQVSPNHRILVASDRTALHFAEREVLVAAKHLVGGRQVMEVQSIGTRYIHFMFDRHQVVLSDGCWTESFQPGDQTLRGMGNAQRSEIYEIFPDLRSDEGLRAYPAARRILTGAEARQLSGG